MTPKIYLSPSDQWANTYAAGDTCEAAQCRRISTACDRLLTAAGCEVINGLEGSMSQRIAASNAWTADLHVAIHSNASPQANVTGTRIFHYPDSAAGDMAARAIFSELAPVCPGSSDKISSVSKLAELRQTTAPAVYCEVEFHDVPAMAEWIVGHTTEIGEAIARGILNYFNMAQPGETRLAIVLPSEWTEASAQKLAELCSAELRRISL